MKPDSVILLIGPDRFQARLFLNELRQKLFKSGSGGLNDQTVDASETELAEIFDLANTLPMLVERRLLVLLNATSPSERDQVRWLRYLENPSPSTVLVTLMDKLDRRLTFSRTFLARATVHPMEPPKPRDLLNWVSRLSAHRGVNLEPLAAGALADAIGPDLGRLDQEIEKLALYIHPRSSVNEMDVTELVLKTTGGTIFAWSDAILEGEIPLSLSSLHHLLENGTPPLVLVTMLARHVRILLKARDEIHAKTDRRRLPSLLGVPPFLVGRYMDQAKKFRSAELQQAIDELQKLDHDLKSTGLPPHLLLERSSRLISKLGT